MPTRCILLYRTDWLEDWDEESVDEYMDILRTATVLEQIHNIFSGTSNLNRIHWCINELAFSSFIVSLQVYPQLEFFQEFYVKENPIF